MFCGGTEAEKTCWDINRCAVTTQGEPGAGVKGEKGEHGSPGYKVNDIFANIHTIKSLVSRNTDCLLSSAGAGRPPGPTGASWVSGPSRCKGGKGKSIISCNICFINLI